VLSDPRASSGRYISSCENNLIERPEIFRAPAIAEQLVSVSCLVIAVQADLMRVARSQPLGRFRSTAELPPNLFFKRAMIEAPADQCIDGTDGRNE
jgi:hypothetical protein